MSGTSEQDGPADQVLPTIVALHFLGGSARTWDVVIGAMAGRFRWITIDLPGFGEAAGETGYSVAAMAAHVADVVRERHAGSGAQNPWALVGHSMGAKVAAVVARRAEDGEPGLQGLTRIVLLAGSPPSPEPMTDAKRATMLGWFAGDEAARQAEAQTFIDDNVGAALAPALQASAVADVLRADRAAWVAWLESGSREDWAQEVGRLATPTLIVAGEKDAALGPAAQTQFMAPHVASGHIVTLDGAGHLLPLERPDVLAALIAQHLDEPDAAEPAIDPRYLALLHSDRVSARTRNVLLQRAAPVPPGTLLSDAAMTTLRAMVDRIMPQPPGPRIDLAARIVAALQQGEGDGWRFAGLPTDAEAFRTGLATLDGLALTGTGLRFAALDPTRQDEQLRRLETGEPDAVMPAPADRLSPAQMRLWFEEVRAAAARAYVAHPATLARFGYGGIANGGDGPRKQGFVGIGPDERESWEPRATGPVQ